MTSTTTDANWPLPQVVPSRTAEIDAKIRIFAQRLGRGSLLDYEFYILAELIRERAKLLRRA